VKHLDFCREQGISAYPTLRLFVKGEKYGEYRGDRTVLSFTNYLATIEQTIMQESGAESGAINNADEVAAERMSILKQNQNQNQNQNENVMPRRMKQEWKDEEHPGCQLSGFLMVDRVPGNFHIKARSKAHDLVASMTNVSHEVHRLSYGDPGMVRMVERNKAIAPSHLNDTIQPLNGNAYVTYDVHTAYHHHLKIITTNFKVNNYFQADRFGKAYQILAQSQLSRYEEEKIPEAKFSYDLSPVAISFRQKSRKWYDYLTSVMAIIGGSFTVVGMMESSIYAASSKKRR